MDYYQDISPWTLNNEKISVVDDNEHLCLVVSGLHEEQENIDASIQQCRNSLFALFGPCYAFKCLLTPTVQIHLWRIYNLPVLCSGLSALPTRPADRAPVKIFYQKILRNVIKLSNSAPIPALHFFSW